MPMTGREYDRRVVLKPGGVLDDCNLLEPPAAELEAVFPPDFGQRVLLTVDVEEEFDWQAPFDREAHGLSHIARIENFQAFCDETGISPLYLVDWPVAQDPAAQRIIGDAAKSGRAEIGVQLHPWVNPPFQEEVTAQNSFAGNLPADLEAEKFNRLADAIESNFGVTPVAFRAGRYGIGPNSASMLKQRGIRFDSSVRALHDFSSLGGPDFTRHPSRPYWCDHHHDLAVLPLTSVYWGLLRKQGRFLHWFLGQVRKSGGIASRLRLLERITLTPEGVTKNEAIRGIDIALDEQLPVLVLSFHSPSLAPGHTPYVRTGKDVETLYDWFRSIYAYLRQRGVRPTTIGEIDHALRA